MLSLRPRFVSLRKDRACPRSVSAARWGHRALPFCRLTGDTNRGQEKASLRVPVEALRNRLVGNTKRGKRIMRFPLQVSSYEISQVSTGDRFAAQIVYTASRCPPIYRLVTDCRSFHFSFTIGDWSQEIRHVRRWQRRLRRKCRGDSFHFFTFDRNVILQYIPNSVVIYVGVIMHNLMPDTG